MRGGTAAALVAAILAAAFPRAASAELQRAKVAVIALSTGEGVSEKTAGMIEEALLNALHRTGRFTVVGRSDVASLIGFERQKQLAGCSESASCAAEIAGALGVPYVGSASLGRIGPFTLVSLKIIRVADARVAARCEERVKSDAELPDALDRIASSAVEGCEAEGCFVVPRTAAPAPSAVPAAALAPPPASPAPARRWRAWTWGLAGAGVLAAAGGGVLGWQSRGISAGDRILPDGAHSLTQAEAERARTLGLSADALFGTAAALGLAAGALLLFD